MRNGLPGYSHRFDRASNIFQFAPCFIVHSLHNDITTRDAFWSDDYEVRRGNIRSLPADSNETSLFGLNPDDHLPVCILIDVIFKAVVWIRTAVPFVKYLILPPRNAANEILPWGCNLNFAVVPVQMQQTRALISFLEARGLSPRPSNTRQQIDSAVLRVINQGTNGPAIAPSTLNEDSGHYVNLEVLTCGEPIICNNRSEHVFKAIQELRTEFDDTFIDNHFGIGRNGVRERAWGRVIGGHFDPTTLR